MHRVIQTLQMALTRANEPASHRAAPDLNACAMEYLFHSILWQAIGMLTRHHRGNRRRTGHAARQRLRRHLGTHHGCADLMTFSVSAAVFEAHVLPYPHLAGRYMQLLADVFADAVHHALTVRAAFLCVGK